MNAQKLKEIKRQIFDEHKVSEAQELEDKKMLVTDIYENRINIELERGKLLQNKKQIK